jgi:hypothetical protein
VTVVLALPTVVDVVDVDVDVVVVVVVVGTVGAITTKTPFIPTEAWPETVER